MSANDSPTTFTDEEIQDLQKTIYRHEVCLGDSGKLLALISRLTAAEKALEMAVCQCPSHGYPEALEAWKKASGKQ